RRPAGAAQVPSQPFVIRFFRETYDELRKVSWPTLQELYRYTLIVVITVIVLAAFIGGVDWGLQQLAQRFIYAGITKS
ncbi:MAG: preprotein translocase subunit SecE, partial [Candidatus Dormiibacterota bacterium]